LTRQALPILAAGGDVSRGAYILADAAALPDVILIATGSEVSVALEAREKLAAQNVHARVVSMPSWELFDAQPKEYRDQVLPPQVTARLAIEAGVPMGWHKYAGDVLAIENRFGASAPFKTLMKEYGFTGDHVVARVLKLLGK
jgi:transketolase